MFTTSKAWRSAQQRGYLPMFFMLRLLLLSFSIVLTIQHPVRATVVMMEPGDEAVDFWIIGAITEADGDQFSSLESLFAFHRPNVFLDNKGGDVAAAIKIGRIIRRYNGQTHINDFDKCLSACALIFISGKSRFMDARGELGFRAPPNIQPPLHLSAIIEFVFDMSVSQRFYEFLMNAHPTNVATFDGTTIKRLVPRLAHAGRIQSNNSSFDKSQWTH
jgi:hypothetical protein